MKETAMTRGERAIQVHGSMNGRGRRLGGQVMRDLAGPITRSLARQITRSQAAPVMRRRTAAVTLIAGTALTAVAGCAGDFGSAPPIAVASAYVPLPSRAAPGTTDAFLDIRNNGPADRLIGARTSVGGKVVFRAPVSQDGAVTRTVPAIAIPPTSTVRLLPGNVHLFITGAGPMRAGKDITIVLTFAHAGTLSVVAQVTDPQVGGGISFAN